MFAVAPPRVSPVRPPAPGPGPAPLLTTLPLRPWPGPPPPDSALALSRSPVALPIILCVTGPALLRPRLRPRPGILSDLSDP